MPDYGNPGPSADSAMYSDESEAPKEKGPEEKEEGTEYPPFTVPKSAFGGKDPQPGEQYYFDVDSVHENEVLMRYAADEKKEEEPAPKPGSPGSEADADMTGMME